MVAKRSEPSEFDEFPALQLKLSSFLDDYGLANRTTIIWQATPITRATLDLKSPELLNVFRRGVSSNENWVNGFSSHEQPTPVFDGLASHLDASQAGWVSEVHEDGHLIAGLWKFPEEGGATFIFPWHADTFTMFAQLTENIVSVGHVEGPYLMTATLFNARALKLRFEHGSRRTCPRAISREVLQWPLLKAATYGDLAATAVKQADRFARLFALNGR